ncbi:hypothetical protein AAVH_33660 [Aphelenchoides avenae]|nr:hypothetical protein AAVH_33660 [Aphelenchus avenae]
MAAVAVVWAIGAIWYHIEIYFNSDVDQEGLHVLELNHWDVGLYAPVMTGGPVMSLRVSNT